MNNQPNLLCRHFQTRLPQPLPVQTINNPQGIFGTYYDPLFKPTVLNTHFDRHPHLVTPHNMIAQPQAYFKDYVRDPDDLYLSTNIAAAPAAFDQNAPAYSSLWSKGINQYAFAVTAPQPPFKIENSPALPIPSVLPRNVDASKYENLSYDDWYTAPTLYQSPSPSSVEYDTNSPATPDDVFSDFSSSFHWNPNTQRYAPDGSNFLLTPKGVPDLTYSATLASPSTVHRPPHATHHGLPSVDHLISTSPYEHPVHAQFYHHHHMAESSLSPQSLDAQTPVESEDDLNDEESSASPPSRAYMLPEDEVDARQHRDELLLKMRNEGHAYRDIKRLGRFKEAESTLRGRYRALTKEKEERVRKPQWQPNDVSSI